MIKSKNYKRSAFPVYVFWFVLILFVLSVILRTFQTVSFGGRLIYLEEQEKNIARENYSLVNQTAENSSLLEVSKKAVEYGFDKPSSIVYLKKDVPVAKLP